MSLDFDLVPVLIEWHDAHVGVDGWAERCDLDDNAPCIVHSCGFLLPTDMGGKENHVSLVATWSDDDMVHSVFHIPLQMVQRITRLMRSHELANVAVFPDEQGSPIRA
jgi:hypothetical protein